MLRNCASKASLVATIIVAALCVSAPVINVNAESIPLSWTSPTTAFLVDVFMVSANDGWAVGGTTSPAASTIIRWDGTQWNTVSSPTTNVLYSVFMVSASDGWAVGKSGTIIRWNGASWTTVTSPTTYDLYSVYMVSANEGWAVGMAGKIIHWDGTQWTTVTSPTIKYLESVYMVGASDGWAVGWQGEIIRWTGTQWVPEFPTIILIPLLISVTLVAVILTKTASKKNRILGTH